MTAVDTGFYVFLLSCCALEALVFLLLIYDALCVASGDFSTPCIFPHTVDELEKIHNLRPSAFFTLGIAALFWFVVFLVSCINLYYILRAKLRAKLSDIA